MFYNLNRKKPKKTKKNQKKNNYKSSKHSLRHSLRHSPYDHDPVPDPLQPTQKHS